MIVKKYPATQENWLMQKHYDENLTRMTSISDLLAGNIKSISDLPRSFIFISASSAFKSGTESTPLESEKIHVLISYCQEEHNFLLVSILETRLLFSASFHLT